MKVHKYVTRLVAGSVAVGTAVSGLLLATTGPAAAAAGTWVPYGDTNPITNSLSGWACGTTVPVEQGVLAQVCAIRTNGGLGDRVQAAVIVRNNRFTLYSASARTDLSTDREGFIDRWTCTWSGVAADSWSVCFGETKRVDLFNNATARGDVNNFSLGVSRRI